MAPTTTTTTSPLSPFTVRIPLKLHSNPNPNPVVAVVPLQKKSSFTASPPKPLYSALSSSGGGGSNIDLLWNSNSNSNSNTGDTYDLPSTEFWPKIYKRHLRTMAIGLDSSDAIVMDKIADDVCQHAIDKACDLFDENESVGVLWVPELCWEPWLAQRLLDWKPEQHEQWCRATGFTQPEGGAGTVPRRASIVQDKLLELINMKATVCVMAGARAESMRGCNAHIFTITLYGWMRLPDLRLLTIPMVNRGFQAGINGTPEPFTRWNIALQNFMQHPSILSLASQMDEEVSLLNNTDKGDDNKPKLPLSFYQHASGRGAMATIMQNFASYYYWCDGRLQIEERETFMCAMPHFSSRLFWRLSKLVQQMALLVQGNNWSVFDPNTSALLDYCSRNRRASNLFGTQLNHSFSAQKNMKCDRYIVMLLAAMMCHRRDWSRYYAHAEAYAAVLHYKYAISDSEHQIHLLMLNNSAVQMDYDACVNAIIGNQVKIVDEVSLAAMGSGVGGSGASDDLMCDMNQLERTIYGKVLSNVNELIAQWRQVLQVDLEEEEATVFSHPQWRISPQIEVMFAQVYGYMGRICT